ASAIVGCGGLLVLSATFTGSVTATDSNLLQPPYRGCAPAVTPHGHVCGVVSFAVSPRCIAGPACRPAEGPGCRCHSKPSRRYSSRVLMSARSNLSAAFIMSQWSATVRAPLVPGASLLRVHGLPIA